MSLDLYAGEDLARGLRATLIIALSTYAANGARNTEHASGILDHGQAQAALYGLDWSSIVEGCRQSLGAGARDLLDQALKSSAIEEGENANFSCVS